MSICLPPQESVETVLSLSSAVSTDARLFDEMLSRLEQSFSHLDEFYI